MASVFDLAMRLRAWDENQAVPRAARSRVALAPHARIFCPLVMAGGDSTLHALAVGQVDRRPRIVVAAEPRTRSAQIRLFGVLARDLTPYLRRCLDDETAPQIIVPTRSAAEVIEALVTRLRFMKTAPGAKRAELDQLAAAREMAMMLGHLIERFELPGQQAIIPATTLIAEHLATGQSSAEDSHLGALLAWADPGAPGARLAAAAARGNAAGTTPSPRFDQEILAPLVEAHGKALASDRSALKAQTAKQVEDAMRTAINPLWDMTQQAVTAFRALELPPLPSLEHLTEREIDSFTRFMESLQKARANERERWPHPPFAAARVRRLIELEDALEQVSSAIVWEDPLARARARFEGNVLHGEVTHSDLDAQELVVRSDQRWLRLRRGDTLHVMSPDGARLRVRDLNRDGHDTFVALSGVAADGDGPILEGSLVDLGSSPPDWGRLSNQMGVASAQMSRNSRLAREGTVLPAPAAEPEPPPADTLAADPVAAVEALR